MLKEEAEELKSKEEFYKMVRTLLTKAETEAAQEENEPLAAVLRGYRLVIFGGSVEWQRGIRRILDSEYKNYVMHDIHSMTGLPKINDNDIVVVNVFDVLHADYARVVPKLRKNSRIFMHVAVLGVSRFKDVLTSELRKREERIKQVM